MEKEKFLGNEGNRIPQGWNSIFGMGIQGSELNCSSKQLPNCFFNLNCENSLDQRDIFEVSRDYISERMKFLQDLVPGCNKVTGKVVMLDEIINYVQSLQRQVEFVSMKLATIKRVFT
ncbi:hypothetical protein Lser_V15G40638 [Lactuca serriola]